MAALEKRLNKLFTDLASQNINNTKTDTSLNAFEASLDTLLELIDANELEEALFGYQKNKFDLTNNALIVCNGDLKLIITTSRPYHGTKHIDLSKAANVVLYDEFVELFRIEGGDQRPALLTRLSTKNLASLLQLHGDLWQLVFQKFYGIQILSQSFSINRNQKSVVVSRELGGVRADHSIEKSAFSDLKAAFDKPNEQLIDINAFFEMQRNSGVQTTDHEHSNSGKLSIFRYSPIRSSILDYGSPTSGLTRKDKVVGYRQDDEIFFREFVSGANYISQLSANTQRAIFDILHMLSIRRSKIYRDYFSKRVYTIVFPPIECLNKHIIVPTVNLNRKPKSGFSGTITISFWVLPQSIQKLNREVRSRKAHISEFFDIHGEFRQTFAQGNTHQHRKTHKDDNRCGDAFWQLPPSLGLGAIVHRITEKLLTQVVCGARCPSIRDLNDVALLIESVGADTQITSTLLEVDWTPTDGDKVPWESWMAGDTNGPFRNVLYRTLFWPDFSNPEKAFSSEKTVEMNDINIGNALGADMTGMTTFLPHETHKICFYPSKFEAYPNYSIVRWAAWQSYLDAAVTSLRALIIKFSSVTSHSGSLAEAIRMTSEMFEEFIDLYDLDLREFFYRKEFEKLRHGMNLDSDYTQLSFQVSAIKEDSLLREQRLINKLVLALTLSTIAAAVLTAAEVDPMAMTILIIVVVIIGYTVFDPLRRLAHLTVGIISWLFRTRRK